MIEKIDLPESRDIYSLMHGNCRTVFANICFKKKVKLFLHHGLKKGVFEIIIYFYSVMIVFKK
jgi:hypothetical protein